MKFVIAVCLLAAPAFAQTSWRWRDEMRQVQADARRAHAEALRSARMARASAMREAAQARVAARRAVEQARRAMRDSYRRERIWRL